MNRAASSIRLIAVASLVAVATMLYELYKNKKTGKLLAVLPADRDEHLIMIARTGSDGGPQAGVIGPTN